MKTIYLAIKIILLLVLLFFAVQNTHMVEFFWFGKGGVNLPLIALLFVAFAVGALFGMFAMLGRILTLRGENNSLKRELKKAENPRLRNRITELLNMVGQEHFGQVFISDTDETRVRAILGEHGIAHEIFEIRRG